MELFPLNEFISSSEISKRGFESTIYTERFEPSGSSSLFPLEVPSHFFKVIPIERSPGSQGSLTGWGFESLTQGFLTGWGFESSAVSSWFLGRRSSAPPTLAPLPEWLTMLVNLPNNLSSHRTHISWKN